MRTVRYILSLFLLTFMQIGVAQEYHFFILEKNRDVVNTLITQTVSIDAVRGDTIFAYATQQQYENLLSYGYSPVIIKEDEHVTKDGQMAATIAEMSNWNKYPTYEVYRKMMRKFEEDYPTLCKLDSIGTSVNGRQLYMLKISKDVDEEGKPEFLYSSTIHGNETTGFILMLRLIDYLLDNYGKEERVTSMLDRLAIYINPNANPDGTYYGGNHTVANSRRNNANNVDLNRNFPRPRLGEDPNKTYQPETQVMIDFAKNRSLVMSANIHGGEEVANFPWDEWKTSTNSHADHNWFYTVSRKYATLAQENGPSGYFTGKDNGVTQGGDWYTITGGRQDYMNYWHHCREITLEISYTKQPNATALPNFWGYNREALLSYIEWMYTGIQGTVTNEEGVPLNATITIEGHDKDNSFVVTNPVSGYYIRLLEPGTYSLTYSAEGYHSQTHELIVNSYEESVQKDVVLAENLSTVPNLLEGVSFSLYPNPFQSYLAIDLVVNSPTHLMVEVYSSLGQRVDIAYQGLVDVGSHHILWNPQQANISLTPGIYLVKLSGGGETITQKVVFYP